MLGTITFRAGTTAETTALTVNPATLGLWDTSASPLAVSATNGAITIGAPPAAFTPCASVALVSTEPGASSDILDEFGVGIGADCNRGGGDDNPNQPNTSDVISFLPPEWTVANGVDVPDGTAVGSFDTLAQLGLLNNPCNTILPVNFDLVDATIDRSNVISLPGTANALNILALDFNGNGIINGAELWPSYLTTLGAINGWDFSKLRARLIGANTTTIPGTTVILNFLIFEPGSHLSNVINIDPALGYPAVTVLQDPTRAGSALDPVSSFCAPLEINSVMNGLAGGEAFRTNPGPGNYFFTTLAVARPDADGDGIENALDPCPYNADSNWNPRSPGVITAGESDGDGIPDSCDPFPNTRSVCTAASGIAQTDEDCDGWMNRRDNCPLVVNPSQHDSDLDQIGDACDLNQNVAPGTTRDGGFTFVCLVSQVTIGNGIGTQGVDPRTAQPCDPAAQAPLPGGGGTGGGPDSGGGGGGGANSLTISPANSEIGIGATAPVELVSVPPAESLATWVIDVVFDPAVVRADSCNPVAVPPGGLSVCFIGPQFLERAETAGQEGGADEETITVAGGGLFPETQRGFDDETVLASITFSTVGAVGECSDLTIIVFVHVGPDKSGANTTNPTTTNGEICIVAPTVTPTPTAAATPQPTAHGANRLAISPANSEVGVGATASVELVSVPPAESLATWVIRVVFDPAVVSVDSCTPAFSPTGPPGSVFVSACEADDQEGGPEDETVVAVGAILFPSTRRGLDDETVLASIAFSAVGAVGECSDLTIDVVSHLSPDPSGPETNPTTTDGEICIVTPTVTPTPTPIATGTATATPTATQPAPTPTGAANAPDNLVPFQIDNNPGPCVETNEEPIFTSMCPMWMAVQDGIPGSMLDLEAPEDFCSHSPGDGDIEELVINSAPGICLINETGNCDPNNNGPWYDCVAVQDGNPKKVIDGVAARLAKDGACDGVDLGDVDDFFETISLVLDTGDPLTSIYEARDCDDFTRGKQASPRLVSLIVLEEPPPPSSGPAGYPIIAFADFYIAGCAHESAVVFDESDLDRYCGPDFPEPGHAVVYGRFVNIVSCADSGTAQGATVPVTTVQDGAIAVGQPCPDSSATPTPTPIATGTVTATPTATQAAPTATTTPTATATSSPSLTPTSTPTATPTETPAPTNPPVTASASPTATPTPTTPPAPTDSLAPTPTALAATQTPAGLPTSGGPGDSGSSLLLLTLGLLSLATVVVTWRVSVRIGLSKAPLLTRARRSWTANRWDWE